MVPNSLEIDMFAFQLISWTHKLFKVMNVCPYLDISYNLKKQFGGKNKRTIEFKKNYTKKAQGKHVIYSFALLFCVLTRSMNNTNLVIKEEYMPFEVSPWKQ
jgi:hypothetical protein